MPYKNPEDIAKWRADNAHKQRQYQKNWMDSPAGLAYIQKQKQARELQKQARLLAKSLRPALTEEQIAYEDTKRRQKDKRYRSARRKKAIALLGGKCVICCIDDHDVLEFDHIAPLLRRTNGMTSKGDTANNVIRDEDRDVNFQLLCSNCHTKKTRLNDEFTLKPKRFTDEDL